MAPIQRIYCSERKMEVDRLVRNPRFCYLLTMQTLSYFISLYFSFLSCKMGIFTERDVKRINSSVTEHSLRFRYNHRAPTSLRRWSYIWKIQGKKQDPFGQNWADVTKRRKANAGSKLESCGTDFWNLKNGLEASHLYELGRLSSRDVPDTH